MHFCCSCALTSLHAFRIAPSFVLPTSLWVHRGPAYAANTVDTLFWIFAGYCCCGKLLACCCLFSSRRRHCAHSIAARIATRGSQHATLACLQEAIEIHPGQLYFWVSGRGESSRVSASSGLVLHVDNELTYEAFANDFGPLHLGCTHRFCRKLSFLLKVRSCHRVRDRCPLHFLDTRVPANWGGTAGVVCRKVPSNPSP